MSQRQRARKAGISEKIYTKPRRRYDVCTHVQCGYSGQRRSSQIVRNVANLGLFQSFDCDQQPLLSCVEQTSREVLLEPHHPVNPSTCDDNGSTSKGCYIQDITLGCDVNYIYIYISQSNTGVLVLTTNRKSRQLIGVTVRNLGSTVGK